MYNASKHITVLQIPDFLRPDITVEFFYLVECRSEDKP